jgi:asparagine synthase (glutamine-hydrolysing)
MRWRGHSDTETLLAGIDVWGLEETLNRCIGMFALALWDKETRSLYLARDRIGEKPLYFGWQRGVFLFGSELKALKAHPAFEGVIDRDAVTIQMRHSYIPAPYSIYRGIQKLLPGHILRICNLPGRDNELSQAYWSFAKCAERGHSSSFSGDDHEAIETLDNLLHSAIAGQMMADVPVGAFLSGGVDSSLVAALMQAQSTRPIKTFSIGFNEAAYNEADHAKAVASHLRTEHTELYVTARNALDLIPRLPTLFDEPFSDSSQIPTFLVAEMARRHVTVSLSGDGGDELFGGYNRYFQTEKWWNRLRKTPKFTRHITSSGLSSIDARYWKNIGKFLAFASSNKVRWSNLATNVGKLSELLLLNDRDSLYRHFMSHWSQFDQVVIGGKEPSTALTNPPLYRDNFQDQMMILDVLSYLPDDILVKLDRAAMGVSLETRVPLLDHRIVEFAFQLPLPMKVRHGQGKWILRQVLYNYVPRHLIERPKMGFGAPIDHWLRGPLRDWAENLLDESRLRQEGFLNPQPIRQKWTEHLSGKNNWQYHLWDVLTFQSWLECQ